VTKLPQLISASKGNAEENGNSHALTGVIEQPTDNHEGNAPSSASPHDNNNDNDISYDNPELIKTFQHINLVFLMISCYYAMVGYNILINLTNTEIHHCNCMFL